eukprot:TRINITY_DN9294_c0_g1_i1.p1 TRINITY_DN9294_c0_g1~~TRINITY_DN9294_c0_g1_i1.p1  ORF type:complete len:108 (-),score=16.67 TRINITY_DN9294_c0_g1_i1:4-327(-)
MKILLLCFILPIALAAKSEKSDVSAPGNDLTCSLCMTLMEVLDATLTDPTNEEQVAIFLDQICAFLPEALKSECDALILEYTDDIIELLVNQYLAPKDVCATLTLCP